MLQLALSRSREVEVDRSWYRAAGVPSWTQTLPEGLDYLTWQRNTANDLAGQFDKSAQTNR